jgi:hypothetical protein
LKDSLIYLNQVKIKNTVATTAMGGAFFIDLTKTIKTGIEDPNPGFWETKGIENVLDNNVALLGSAGYFKPLPS